MAGERQHFIPQFVQAGFASQRKGNEAYTWVFRKAADPFNANIKNSGVERQFYTEPGDTLADDLITQAEGKFAALVNRLRDCPIGAVSEQELPAFVAHLEVRTRHLRATFLEAGNYLFSQIVELLSDQNLLIKLVEREMTRDPAFVRQQVKVAIDKLGPQVQALAKNPAVEAAMVSKMHAGLKAIAPQLAATFKNQKGEYLGKLAHAAKAGHIRSIKEAVSPPIRVENYQKFSYRMMEAGPSNLILGDSAVLFLVDGTRKFRPYVDKSHILDAVFLPLAHNRLLVGERKACDIDFAELKRQIARSSFEYFISHENTEENRLLRKQIGIDAAPLTQNELDGIVFNILQLGGA